MDVVFIHGRLFTQLLDEAIYMVAGLRHKPVFDVPDFLKEWGPLSRNQSASSEHFSPDTQPLY